MKVGFHPVADEEFRTASADYERRLGGLGKEFIREVEAMCAVLAEHPAYGRKLDDTHRQVPLRRFPYVLVYRPSDSEIRVIAVAHKRRRPRYWASRN